jgi:hypothetical protein
MEEDERLEIIVNIEIDGKIYQLKVRFPHNINLKKRTWPNEIELIPIGEAPDSFYKNERYKDEFLSNPGISEIIKTAIKHKLEEIKNREKRLGNFPF